jgi:hypothetical protein
MKIRFKEAYSALYEDQPSAPPIHALLSSVSFLLNSSLCLFAASLGQVYKGKLKSNGDAVAVKVQRPYVLETVRPVLALTLVAILIIVPL